jgi:hypothetical protein
MVYNDNGFEYFVKSLLAHLCIKQLKQNFPEFESKLSSCSRQKVRKECEVLGFSLIPFYFSKSVCACMHTWL